MFPTSIIVPTLFKYKIICHVPNVYSCPISLFKYKENLSCSQRLLLSQHCSNIKRICHVPNVYYCPNSLFKYKDNLSCSQCLLLSQHCFNILTKLSQPTLLKNCLKTPNQRCSNIVPNFVIIKRNLIVCLKF